MADVSLSIVVERPIEEVFAFVTDARNDPLWQAAAGLWESRLLPEGPVGVGTQILELWHAMGVKAQATSEVTTYEPCSRYTLHHLCGSCPFAYRTQVFEPLAHSTRWTCTALVRADGAFAPVGARLAAHMREMLRASMAEAKSLLEQR